MQSFFTNYLNNLQELHDEIRGAAKDLPAHALDWTTGVDTNSINVLVVHLTGAERYWIGDVIMRDLSGRDRDSEFRVHGLSSDDLLQRLSNTEIYFQSALETLTPQELEEVRISPRNGRELTLGWALCHVLKHTALHVGHIQLTRQLWQQGQSN